MAQEPRWTPKEQNLATFTRANEYNQRKQDKQQVEIQPEWCQYTGELALLGGTFFRKCKINNYTCNNFSNLEAVKTCPEIQKQNIYNQLQEDKV